MAVAPVIPHAAPAGSWDDPHASLIDIRRETFYEGGAVVGCHPGFSFSEQPGWGTPDVSDQSSTDAQITLPASARRVSKAADAGPDRDVVTDPRTGPRVSLGLGCRRMGGPSPVWSDSVDLDGELPHGSGQTQPDRRPPPSVGLQDEPPFRNPDSLHPGVRPDHGVDVPGRRRVVGARRADPDAHRVEGHGDCTGCFA